MFQGKTATFRWYEDTDTGPGWVMASMPHFDTVKGFGMAHDMIEHFTPRAGNAGEAEAFGAMVWVRWDGCYWGSLTDRRRESLMTGREHAESLASDLSNFLAFSDYEMVAPCDFELAPEPEDEEVREILRLVAAYTARQCRIHDHQPIAPEQRHVIRHLYQWLCIGYQNVQTFYDHNAQAIAALFADIEKTIDLYSEAVEHYSGDEIEVTISADYTWEYKVINGQDMAGDYWEEGRPVGSNDEEDEDE